MFPPPLRNSFTPINRNGPLNFTKNSPTELSAKVGDDKNDPTADAARAQAFLNPSRKRKRGERQGDTNRTRRQARLPVTPASTPFQTLKVTKPAIRTDDSPWAKYHNSEHSFSYDSSRKTLDSSQHLPLPTTMEQLSPVPSNSWRNQHVTSTRRPAGGGANSDDAVLPENLVSDSEATKAKIGITLNEVPTISADDYDSEHRGARATVGILQQQEQQQGLPSESEDEYPLDDLLAEDMSLLLSAAQGPFQEQHIPPSSVTQGWDYDSRSAAAFDATLQYSSPAPSHQSGVRTDITPSRNIEGDQPENELLDEDVDWEAVFAVTAAMPKDPSLVACPHEKPAVPELKHDAGPESSVHRPLNLKDPAPLSAFNRPPFPEMVRDQSSVPGLSSDTVLRTCFRTGVMISQTACCINHRQGAVFELFARVTYSTRERLAKRQYFQFVDLFKDQQPYPTGILSDWKSGSQRDRDSSVFLHRPAGPKLCWCLCKAGRDRKTYAVLCIKETSWEQIRWSKGIVCGEDQRPDDISAMAKL
ncbi:hypothetical protein F4780DRAFT_140416 [Xylariomycetidae sp. FL0641]|nr:hypothetical protein F4780DRAFT_140416 [Xylariomycetidae sp. FL0641]